MLGFEKMVQDVSFSSDDTKCKQPNISLFDIL